MTDIYRSMHIKKSQLAEIIKAVVRETIKERKAEWVKHNRTLCENNVSEVAPPGFDPKGKYAKAFHKIKAQYPNNDGAAYATMWKLHKKLTEAGLTSEASYKRTSPIQVDRNIEDKARAIQTDPEVNEASYKVVAPHAVDTNKEDKARAIQVCPKVTENHKVQHRSHKTVKDLHNDPKNVRDPEVPQA